MNITNSLAVEQQSRDLFKIARNRSTSTLILAARIEKLAIQNSAERAAFVAARLRACACPSNIFIARDMHDAHGETFDTTGALWRCGSVLCANCLADRSRKHRQSAASLANLKLRVGEKFALVTATMPAVPRPLLESINTILRAWLLFRKRRVWASSVAAGVRCVEFTVNPETRVPHVHLHSLVAARYMRRDELSRDWASALGVPTALVDIREIRARVPSKPAFAAALDETVKYLAKSAAFASLSNVDLLALADCEKLPRLFEKIGKRSYLDTPVLAGGENLKEKPSKIAASPDTLRLQIVDARHRAKARMLKHFSAAEFVTLDGKDF